jgi:hypothetical protein
MKGIVKFLLLGCDSYFFFSAFNRIEGWETNKEEIVSFYSMARITKSQIFA